MGNAPTGPKKVKSTSEHFLCCFSPQSVSQQSVWALKVRLGKIDFWICPQRAVGCVAASELHNPQTQPIKPKCANFDPNFASNSKTAHFERKRWAPPFKPCPRGVHWWWSRPNWLSWRRETWLGPSKKCHLGPLWMEGKNCPRGSEKLMGTARGDRGSGIFFSAPELKN